MPLSAYYLARLVAGYQAMAVLAERAMVVGAVIAAVVLLALIVLRRPQP